MASGVSFNARVDSSGIERVISLIMISVRKGT
jgi:hypothetical protein